MDQHLLQGWQADPFGLHEQRYFSAGRPTKLVRDGRVEAYDEPPAPDLSPDGAAAADFAPADDQATGAGLGASETPGVYQGQPARVVRDAVQVGYPGAPYRGGPARRRRTGLVNGVVALVAVAAIIVFVAAEGGFIPKHGPKSNGSIPAGANLAAFVTRSARQTLGQKTADVTVTGRIEVAGNPVSLSGTGQLDFANNTGAVNLSASYSGTKLTEDEIMTSQALYIQMTINGQSLAQYFGGRHWFEVPLSASAPVNSQLGDPTMSLRLLQQQGARVVPLGAQSVGGLTCDAYSVTPSQRATLAAAQQDWARMGLSSSETAAAQQVLENSEPATIMVWLDPVRDLTCQLSVSMQLGTGSSAAVGGAPTTTSVEMLMTMKHYGVPVTITSPPQSDTIPFSSLGQ